MDNYIIDKYKQEMLAMKRSAIPAAATQQEQSTAAQNTADNTGELLGIVTAIRGLYPVKNAKVTIFTDSIETMKIIDSDLTDQNGRTKFFKLPTPEKALSLDQSNTALPYAVYNMQVEADGYVKNIHLNVPVFSTITSIQQSNLLPLETAGPNKEPQIFDESQKYEL